MSTINELYQEIIIDHGSNPRNKGILFDCTHKADGYNASCGDELSIFLYVENDIIKDIKFHCQGCSISCSSGSMMTDKIKGMSLVDAFKFSQMIQKMLNNDDVEIQNNELGDLVSLLGVKKFPMRIKCATLAWHTLDNAISSHIPLI